jgi:hypothetical protein
VDYMNNISCSRDDDVEYMNSISWSRDDDVEYMDRYIIF